MSAAGRRACASYEGCRGEGWTHDLTDDGSGATVYCDCPAGEALRARDAATPPAGATFNNCSSTSPPLDLDTLRKFAAMAAEEGRQRRRPIFCHSLADVRDAANAAGLGEHFRPAPDGKSATLCDVPVHVDPHIAPGTVYRLAEPLPTREESLRQLRAAPLFTPAEPDPPPLPNRISSIRDRWPR